MTSNPFPGFAGAPGTYPLDVDAAGARPSEPVEDGFRGLPRDSGVLRRVRARQRSGASARCSRGLSGCSWAARRKACPDDRSTRSATGAQTYAYWLLVTDAYPHASPLEGRGARARAVEPSRSPDVRPGVSGRRAAQTAALAVVAGCWLVAAWWPVADEGAVLAAPAAPRPDATSSASRSSTTRRRSSASPGSSGSAGSSSSWRSSSLYARRAPGSSRESAAGPIGTGMLLGMLGFALALARGAAVRACSTSGGSGATISSTRATGRRSSAAGSGSAASSCSSASRSRS